MASYDDRVLRAAEAVAQQPCHGKSVAIDRERALPIVAAATDGKSVTAVERRTIKRVIDTYTFTSDAKAELLGLLDDEPALLAMREPDPPFYQCRIT